MSLISFKQVFAGTANGARKLHLFRGQVAIRIRRKLIGENEQAVQRRAQLVGHVREELGLVARGERELLRFAFQRLARLLDFAVLASRPRRFARRVVAPFPPAPGWSAVVPPAGFATRRRAIATA